VSLRTSGVGLLCVELGFLSAALQKVAFLANLINLQSFGKTGLEI
jgi:hypothetical protein